MKWENANIDISGMTSEGLINHIRDISKTNKEIEQIFERNQLSYVVRFFSGVLMEKGKYIEGTALKDLLTLYYIDFYLKRHLAKNALKINRYLNIAILNSFTEGKISKSTGDTENTFGAVVRWFRDELNDSESLYVIDKFNSIYSTNFKDKENFIEHLNNILDLRNFTLHHYAIVSYEYASIIKNGEAHMHKNGKRAKLEDAIYSLTKFINKKTADGFMKKCISIIFKYSWSTDTIKDRVEAKTKEILNFAALQKVKRENIHFSLIDLLHMRNVEK